MVKHGWRALVCTLAAALLLAPAARADVLIDFESITPYVYLPGETIASDGYEFTIDALGLGVVDTAEAFFFGGAPTNASGQFLAILNDGAVTLEDADHDPFSLQSFAFAFISPFAGAGMPGVAVGRIVVSALAFNGTTIVQAFEFPASDGDGNFSFGTASAALLDPAFGGALLGVTFSSCVYDDAGACAVPAGLNLAQFALDNVALAAAVPGTVPEPGTLALLALALAGLVAVRRGRLN